MRLDVRAKEYRPRHPYRVFVDCVEVKDCVAVDTEQGWADVLVRGDDGRLVADLARNEVATKRLHGSVRVERMT